jgi:hypothetical protein
MNCRYVVSFLRQSKGYYTNIRSLLFLLFCVFAHFSVRADAPALSAQSRVSILTCGPGALLYEAFGHSAVRVSDPTQALDLVFNYGVFDFNQENFYGNFAKGSMRYMLGVSTWTEFQEQYRRDHRSIREQVLNLDSAEKQAVVSYLSINLLPENREYFYDYFDNNCSTKILELLDSALSRRVVLNYSEVEGKASFREMIYDYTTYQPWGRLGIDLGLGSVIDRKLKGSQLNFLPDELEKTISRASIRRGMIDYPLVIENHILFESPVYFGAGSFLFSPGFLFSVVLLLSCLAWYKSGSIPFPFKLLRSLLFTSAGLLGCVQLSIWLFTNHKSAAWNYNLLWANPIFFAVGLLIWFYEKPMRVFLVGFRYYLLLLLILWFIVPQHLNTDLLPLVASLCLLSVPAGRSVLSVTGAKPDVSQ